ncbi:hypothetical protein Dsin_009017 [Dipteronia sinensis]|uniref:Reverse transcriptase domain-containing protein n=1 Tax=Dipteronia sinensis TaxID=43782 RepID=A0AAE0EBP5_9ROSI|nr:hypothetical protein Dsin_009017 [Dipteronia sinensis]
MINAIQEFFTFGHLLKKLNATILALVPKVLNPSKMKDFRSISCCNTLYKIISKIIANRIKPYLADIISPSQSVFVAVDLIMLCHGSPSSALVLEAALDEFSLLSGFPANQAKSNIFTSGLSSTTNQQLINLFGYTVGSLPIRYLGISVISTKLCLRDCSPLVEKVSGRLTSWLNRGISYAGRLQLIISVLKLLNLRPIARPLIQHFIGNGSSTSLWFDNWHPDGTLLSKWSPRMVYDSGLPLNATVNAIVLGDSWSWPAAMSIDLVKIRSWMPSYNPNSNIEDSIL